MACALAPLFSPCAERYALTYVLSICILLVTTPLSVMAQAHRSRTADGVSD